MGHPPPIPTTPTTPIMEHAMPYTILLINATWQFVGVILGVMLGSTIISRVIAQKDISL